MMTKVRKLRRMNGNTQSPIFFFLEITVIQLQMQHLIVSIRYQHLEISTIKKNQKENSTGIVNRTTTSFSSALVGWNKLVRE